MRTDRSAPETAGTLRIGFRIHAGSGRDPVPERLSDGSYRLSLKSPPVDGRANEELVRFLSESFGAPRSAVTILAGASSRRKLVRIDGASRLPAWFGSGDGAGPGR